MNGPAAPPGDPVHVSCWKEFCEQHAVTTAKDLARKYLLFVDENPQHEGLAAENFSLQFADLFQQYFRNEVKETAVMSQFRSLPFCRVRDYRETNRRQDSHGSPGSIVAKAEVELFDQTDRVPDACPHGLPKSWSSEELTETASPLAVRRHFSLDRLRQSWRSFFRRKPSESGPSEGEVPGSVLKPTLAQKILPRALLRDNAWELQKEGNLKYWMVTEATMDNGTRWQRCRLVLRKTGTSDSEDFVLELFDPPKVSEANDSGLSHIWGGGVVVVLE